MAKHLRHDDADFPAPPILSDEDRTYQITQRILLAIAAAAAAIMLFLCWDIF